MRRAMPSRERMPQHPARASSRGGVPWIWIVIGAIVVIAIIAAVANRSSSTTVEHVEHHHHDDDIRKAG